MIKAILKGTTLKTEIHIALIRISFRSHCTFSLSNFWHAIFMFGDLEGWNMSVNFIILLKIQLFWFPAGQIIIWKAEGVPQ